MATSPFIHTSAQNYQRALTCQVLASGGGTPIEWRRCEKGTARDSALEHHQGRKFATYTIRASRVPSGSDNSTFRLIEPPGPTAQFFPSCLARPVCILYIAPVRATSWPAKSRTASNPEAWSQVCCRRVRSKAAAHMRHQPGASRMSPVSGEARRWFFPGTASEKSPGRVRLPEVQRSEQAGPPAPLLTANLPPRHSCWQRECYIPLLAAVSGVSSLRFGLFLCPARRQMPRAGQTRVFSIPGKTPARSLPLFFLRARIHSLSRL